MNEASGKTNCRKTTVKVNLISVSIAGRRGFVKADYITADSPLVLWLSTVPFIDSSTAKN
jgi:hypothetical protein